MTVRVVKLGGSLLGWPGLADAWRAWRARQAPAAVLVVVGGGSIVEALRALDRGGSLGDEAAHWLAVRAMSLTAALAARLLEEAQVVDDVARLRFDDVRRLQIVDVERFLRADATTADRLPANWNVTSDSIAARLAARLRADELVLLKSRLPAAGATRETLASDGYLDEYFPAASGGLCVRAVNLRDAAFPETSL